MLYAADAVFGLATQNRTSYLRGTPENTTGLWRILQDYGI